MHTSHAIITTILTFALIGCAGSAPPQPSRFFSKLDLTAEVSACLPDDATWGGHGSGSGGGGSPQNYEHSKHYAGDLNCDGEAAGAFVLCLSDKLKRLIESSNGKWEDIRESSDDDPATPAFHLNYNVESRAGTIRASLGKSGDERFPFEFNLKVEETLDR